MGGSEEREFPAVKESLVASDLDFYGLYVQCVYSRFDFCSSRLCPEKASNMDNGQVYRPVH
jgi:hypothetical protein